MAMTTTNSEKKRLTIYWPEEERERAKRMARERGISLSELVGIALEHMDQVLRKERQHKREEP